MVLFEIHRRRKKRQEAAAAAAAAEAHVLLEEPLLQQGDNQAQESPGASASSPKQQQQEAARQRQASKRMVSLSEVERVFLKNMLFSFDDDNNDDDKDKDKEKDKTAEELESTERCLPQPITEKPLAEEEEAGGKKANKKLTDSMMFNVPTEGLLMIPVSDSDYSSHPNDNDKDGPTSTHQNTDTTSQEQKEPKNDTQPQPASPLHLQPKTRRFDSSLYIGLWRAFEDGVTPTMLQSAHQDTHIKHGGDARRRKSVKHHFSHQRKSSKSKSNNNHRRGGSEPPSLDMLKRMQAELLEGGELDDLEVTQKQQNVVKGVSLADIAPLSTSTRITRSKTVGAADFQDLPLDQINDENDDNNNPAVNDKDHHTDTTTTNSNTPKVCVTMATSAVAAASLEAQSAAQTYDQIYQSDIDSDASVPYANDEDVEWDDDDLDKNDGMRKKDGFDHYDAWQVLKDEYAADFGFVYGDSIHTSSDPLVTSPSNANEEEGDSGTPPGDSPDEKTSLLASWMASQSIHNNNSDDDYNAINVQNFKILGTSADDVSAQPHVLSPPLLESLLNFLPESLQEQNPWLKFSLVRDGAHILNLREHCKHSTHTILALETTSGEVFGSFTSTPWKKSVRYFGTGESFLWKMRQSRYTKCYSLWEQAKLESEVDVYLFSGLNYYVQLCTEDKLAIGGGALVPSQEEGKKHVHEEVEKRDVGLKTLSQWEEDHDGGAPSPERLHAPLKKPKSPSSTEEPAPGGFGFGIAINKDLLYGTSSPCATFRNPSLFSHSAGEDVYEIVNLEVWTLTPCETVKEAEALEMSKSWRESQSEGMGGYGSVESPWSTSQSVQSMLGEGYGRSGGGVA